MKVKSTVSTIHNTPSSADRVPEALHNKLGKFLFRDTGFTLMTVAWRPVWCWPARNIHIAADSTRAKGPRGGSA